MDLAASVRAEQIRTLYRQSRLLLWTNVAISAIISATLWWSAARGPLLLWVASMALIAVARSKLVGRFLALEPSAAELEPWARRFTFAAMLAGAAWGAGSVVFYDSSSPLSQILLTFAVGGMTAAAAGTWASHPPAFWGYFVCSLGPLLARSLAVGDPAHWSHGAACCSPTPRAWRAS